MPKTTKEKPPVTSKSESPASGSTTRSSRSSSSSTKSSPPTSAPTVARPSRSASKSTPRPSTRRAKPPQSEAVASEPIAQEAPAAPQGVWRRIDLHMHTPGSADYEQPGVTYLDILQQAERRGLDIIAFTDHNTVNGFRQMQREIADLELLEELERIKPDEMGRLMEYRRLLKKILVLPGFEFTGTFGFHILGIFPPEKRLRDIEYLLVQMHVPGEALDKGLTEAGATSDVLTAYRLIDEAGGLAIAAHANSSSGVLMRGVTIGGQTRIAFTQDSHLAAVELTDLNKGRRSMAYWLSGIKAEYPRRMHIIQSSDAHRLTASNVEARRLGVGERATEVQVTEPTFEALRSLFLSQDFHRVRPARAPLNITVEPARELWATAASASLAFHPALPKRGNRFDAVLQDVCAMSNGEGGAVVIGCEAGTTKKVAGVPAAEETARKLSDAIQERLTPALTAVVRVQPMGDAEVIEVTVPRSEQAPHAIDGAQFFIRPEAETKPASRDDIVAIVRRVFEAQAAQTARHRGGGQPHQRQDQPRQPQGQPQPQRQPQQQQQQRQARPQGGLPQGQQQSQQQSQQQPQQQQPQQQSGRAPQNQPRQQGQRQGGRESADQGRGQPRGQAPAVSAPEPVRPAADNGAALPAAAQPQANGAAPVTVPSTPATPPAIIDGMPRSGVHIASVEEREGIRFYTVHDLRNNTLVRNVTIKSARDLWHYAIIQYNTHAYAIEDVQWNDQPGDAIRRAVLNKAFRAGKMRYDLAMRAADGAGYIFYGVAEDGMDAAWRQLLNRDQPATEHDAATEAAPSPEPAGGNPAPAA